MMCGASSPSSSTGRTTSSSWRVRHRGHPRLRRRSRGRRADRRRACATRCATAGPTTAARACVPTSASRSGHRRLSIIDLSPAGHQPMSNEDGTVWITYNGEVYNHAELRAELEAQGPPFTARAPTPRRSSTSTRRRARAASSASTACSPSRSGTRAGASSSSPATGSASSRSTTRCCRRGLLFGSEIKALLEHPAAARRDLDEEAFYDYLTFAFTPPPRTMFEGIRKLGAGGADDRARPTAQYAASATGATDAVGRASPTRSRAMTRGRDGRRGPRTCCATRSQAHDVRRPVRRLPLRRRGLLDQRRADGRAHRRAGAHVLDRARAGTRATTSSTTPAWSRGASAPTTTRSSSTSDDLASFMPELRLPPGRAARPTGRRPAALRHQARPRDGHDRRAGRRGRRRALPRLQGLRRPPARRGAVPALRAGGRCAVADGRRGGARHGRAGPRHPPRRGALRRGPQPRPVLGRRALLPRPAQGRVCCATAHARRLYGRVERSGTRPTRRAAMPTSSRR